MAQELRRAMRLSQFSAVWTTASSLVSLGIGAAVGSIVLVVFGAIGLLDAAGSLALVLHFRHLIDHARVSVAHERVAFLVINIGLVVVGAVTIVISALRLTGTHHHHDAAVVGIVNAAIAGIVLVPLSARKRSVGRALGDRSLVADGRLSATGAALAAITVAGTASDAIFDAWWLDPIAAIAVGTGAIVVAGWQVSGGSDRRRR
jgi:divalent metal cation (Fe/Co/Zn/Cd) transporter